MVFDYNRRDLIKLIIQVVVMLLSFSFFITMNASARSQQTIELSNGETVRVSYREQHNGYEYEVMFENGRSYFYKRSGNSSSAGGSLELTDEEWKWAEEAISKYEQINGAASISNNSSSNPIGLVLILLGILGAIFPQAAWYMEIGWKVRNTEPSELALIANRVGGIVIAIVGLFVLL